MERALYRRLTIARKAIGQITESAEEHDLTSLDWSRWRRSAEGVLQRTRKGLGLSELSDLVEQFERIGAEGEAILTDMLKPVETAPAGAVCCASTTATKHLQADKSAPCNPAYKRTQRADADGDRAANAREARPADPIDSISPRFLARLSPSLTRYLVTDAPLWPDIVTAADWLRGDLGIGRSAWIDSCHIMGREGAATAVAIIAAKRAQIRSPGGYLRGMTDRARAGQLNLMRSLWGLAEARAVQTRLE